MYFILFNNCLVFYGVTTPNNTCNYHELPLRRPSISGTHVYMGVHMHTHTHTHTHTHSLTHRRNLPPQKPVTAAGELYCHFFVMKMPYFWMYSIQMLVPYLGALNQ